jgi:FdhE protein
MRAELLSASAIWNERRERAVLLAERHPHAAELLQLYAALCTGWAEVAEEIREARPGGDLIAGFALEHVLPKVVEATLVAGPETLRSAVLAAYQKARVGSIVQRWLDGDELPPAERYLARASASPVLETAGAASSRTSSDPRRCPHCGGLPQLAYFGISGEALVTAPRSLLCSRCGQSWTYPRMVCAGCGSEDTSRLPIFNDAGRFPSLRVDACEVCSTYLVTVDLPKDPHALPVVDELAALPLDLYARDRGFTKITPNLMGF